MLRSTIAMMELAAGRRRNLLLRPSRFFATSGATAASPVAGAPALRRMKRFVLIGSVGLGMMTVAPLFWFLGRVAGEGLPVSAQVANQPNLQHASLRAA